MQNLNEILDKADIHKPANYDTEKCNMSEREKVREYFKLILDSQKNEHIEILFRGEKKQGLKSKLISKLNSNNSLYDSLFLVGDKAKSYLEKEEKIPHSVRINSTGKNTANWIFDEYKLIDTESTGTEYFESESNRDNFTTSIKGKSKLVDYYLMRLHTWTSKLLVNFVSATSLFSSASSHGNDFVIILWKTEGYSKHVMIASNLRDLENSLSSISLPVIKNFHKSEEEYTFKGFILPHYILGAYSIGENKLIINPALLEDNNPNWIQDGFEIDDKKFSEFIKKTHYKRFLTLHDNEGFEEKNTK